MRCHSVTPASYSRKSFMVSGSIIPFTFLSPKGTFMCDTKFYICEHCGNLIGMIHNAGVPVMYCGRKMTKLEAGVTDAAAEKHVPVICTLSPVDTKSKQNYTVCNCNNVTYFDILDAIGHSERMDTLLALFENVKNTT